MSSTKEQEARINKVLFFSYGFPPRGGSGVQRNIKFLKYLNRFGWSTSVVVPKPYEFHVYDPTLLREIEGKTKIFKTESLDPLRIAYVLKRFLNQNDSAEFVGKSSIKNDGIIATIYRSIRNWFFFPDSSIGWLPFAAYRGMRVISKENPDAIFASFPGATNAVVAYLVSKSARKPLVLDFRDGWLDDPYIKFPTKLHRWGHALLERKILGHSSQITVYGDILRERFEIRYPGISHKISIIPNGFDTEDIVEATSLDSDKLVLTYSGSMYGKRTSNFTWLIEALTLLPKELQERIVFKIVGPTIDGAEDLILQKNLEKNVFFTGYVSHEEALNHLAISSCGIVFLPPNEFTGITGKVFEYLGNRLPVLACVEPEGACSNLLKGINWDQGVAKPDSPSDIARAIIRLDELGWPKLGSTESNLFSREKQTRMLEGALLAAIEKT